MHQNGVKLSAQNRVRTAKVRQRGGVSCTTPAPADRVLAPGLTGGRHAYC